MLRIFAAACLVGLFPVVAGATAPPLPRTYKGPDVSPEAPDVEPDVVAPEPSEPPPPSDGPPEDGPPPSEGAPPPSEGAPPPSEAAPAPKDAPPPPTVADVPEEDAGNFDFEVVDLTEDEAALQKELEVKTKKVVGKSGVVTGKLLDSTSGDPIIGAYVETVTGGYKTKTDGEGNFTLELPVGTHELRVRSDVHQPRRLSNVVVEEGKSQSINSELEPLEGAGQTVLVKTEMNKESEGARMMQRRESAASRDIMSRDQIKKSGGGSTAQVARRIVGVTIIDGKYVFVRGLGHRYGNTLFDGARVPSPEPDLRTVPLDIFPSSALSAINVQKTFTPDVPADFTGGSVQLESREIPKKLVFDVFARTGMNTATTFRGILHEGGFAGPDAFGFGNIPRGLPDAIPRDNPASRNALGEDLRPVWTADDMERFGESLYTDTRVRRGRVGPPNVHAGATLGYGFSPHKGGKLGFLGTVAYRNMFGNFRDHWSFYDSRIDPMTGRRVLEKDVDMKGTRTINNVQWSAVGLTKYEPVKKHKLSLLAFYSRDADDEVREYRGTNDSDQLLTSRIRYVMRSILMTRLGGVHEFEKAKGFTVDWFGSYAQARRDDPSIRDMVFQAQDDGSHNLVGQGATNTFLDLVDHTESGALNFTMPFRQWGQLDGKVKIGGWAEGKQRTFAVRRFTFQPNGAVAQPLGTGNIIVDNTIGGGPGATEQAFFVDETTQPFDSYKADQQIYAGYGMLELPFVRWFKVTGGARFEANRQRVEPYDQFGEPQAMDVSSRVKDNDVLPSVGLIFPVTEKQNIRLSGTRTVARPEFREIAPFLFTDFVGGITIRGTPGLRSSKIWNADLRWEWFPSAEEVISVSAFYKYFDKPIERTITPGTSNLVSTFRNAEFAYNIGGEAELRKNLEFIWKGLSDLSLGANFAYVHSRVELGESCDIMTDPMCEEEMALDVSTSRSRPLQGQSPFVANAFIDYDNGRSGTQLRLLYNAVGSNLAFVGGANMPDIYADALHQLDLVASQRVYKGLDVTFGVLNMLNWPTRWRHHKSSAVVYQVYPGATIWLGLAYSM